MFWFSVTEKLRCFGVCMSTILNEIPSGKKKNNPQTWPCSSSNHSGQKRTKGTLNSELISGRMTRHSSLFITCKDALCCLKSHITFTGVCLSPEDKALGAGAGVAARCVAAQSIVTQQTIDSTFINICEKDRVSELQHQSPFFQFASPTALQQPERHRNAPFYPDQYCTRPDV